MVPLPLRQPWPITSEGMELVIGVWSRKELFADAVQKAMAAPR